MCMFKEGIITPTWPNNKPEVQKVNKQCVQVHRISGISGLVGISAQVCLNPMSHVLFNNVLTPHDSFHMVSSATCSVFPNLFLLSSSWLWWEDVSYSPRSYKYQGRSKSQTMKLFMFYKKSGLSVPLTQPPLSSPQGSDLCSRVGMVQDPSS